MCEARAGLSVNNMAVLARAISSSVDTVWHKNVLYVEL